MKLKRIFAGIMSAAIALSLFGCASTTETADTQGESGTSQQAEDTSWTDVQEAGKIVIGVVGFDIDLANAVCEKLGVQAEIKPIDWSAKEAELAAGSIDLIWNGYTVTDERREKVLFTDPYLANSQIIVTKEGYGVESKNDLTGSEQRARRYQRGRTRRGDQRQPSRVRHERYGDAGSGCGQR